MRRLGEKLGTRLDAERSAIRCHSDEEYSGNGIRFRRSTLPKGRRRERSGVAVTRTSCATAPGVVTCSNPNCRLDGVGSVWVASVSQIRRNRAAPGGRRRHPRGMCPVEKCYRPIMATATKLLLV